MIPFQKAYGLDKARPLIDQVLASGRTEGDGTMTLRCQEWLSERFGVSDILMMTSCTHALEEAMQVIGLNSGDEVIVPSFAYPSAANAVMLAGGTVVFAEVEPRHLTLDPDRLTLHLTPRTRAVIVVHYGGISCDMARILAITEPRGILVIEDCAQSFLTRCNNQYTGTIGHLGCFSFHGTKDVVAGEGGALVVNDSRFSTSAHLFRQKGTNWDDFTGGKVDFYEWVTTGSSHAPGELQMALLASQLTLCDEILVRRQRIFARYVDHYLDALQASLYLKTLAGFSTPDPCGTTNGHLFYLLFRDPSIANGLVRHLSQAGIDARTHFVPMHDSRFGRQFVRAENQFEVEKDLDRRLVRLPLFTEMTEMEQNEVLAAVDDYLSGLHDGR